MSISSPTDFDRWLAEEFAVRGAFTLLIVLVAIKEQKVTPLRSSFVHVIGDEIDWSQVSALLAGAGTAWDGVSFFPAPSAGGGPLDTSAARFQLRQLQSRLDDDRLVLNEGRFFDPWGRRIMVEEVAAQ